MAVSKRLRYEVLNRDGFACRYCGGEAPDVKLTVDHVVPVALGGNDTPENLVTACRDCNAGKSSTSPDAPVVAGVADDALRWAAAMREAANIEARDREKRQSYRDGVESVWSGWTRGDKPVHLPDTFGATIDTFVEAGLESGDMTEAIEIAMANATGYGENAVWRYFCGVCWRKITARQEAARAIIEAGE